MLSCLNIKNVALIETLNIEWYNGMTVLTGETGAGKSIIIDCVNLLLGARSDKSLVRFGADKAKIQGMFCVSQEVLDFLQSEGIDTDGSEILIDRELTKEGRSICRINGIMTTQNILREVGAMLINIHGQQDNQALLRPEKHINFLDKYSKTDLTKYNELYLKRREILKELEKVNKNQLEREQKTDILKYQINELEQADLRPGEEETLKEQKNLADNSEKIIKSLNEAYSNLYGDNCAYDKIANAVLALEKISGIDGKIDESLSKITDVKYIIEDSVHEIGAFLENIDFDENTLNEVEERLDVISRLNKKYGGSIEACLEFLQNAKVQLNDLDNFEERTAELTKKLSDTEKELLNEAKMLSKVRGENGIKLQKEIEEALTELDMPNVKFSVSIKEEDDFTPTGRDRVEFYICPNTGEELKELVKIASGGELSRVMLAIKSIIADSVDTLIFDEIDTGVSGSAAQKIAKKLSGLGKDKQVICVSHSPQIAAISDNHLFISKSLDEGRTVTSVRTLSNEERVLEIARIIDGTNITETAIKHAKEMIGL